MRPAIPWPGGQVSCTGNVRVAGNSPINLRAVFCKSMPMQVKFSVSTPGADRIHYVNEQDVRVLLDRLPHTLWSRLRAVHFNDRSRGNRTLGYVSARGRREIALCALPPRRIDSRPQERTNTRAIRSATGAKMASVSCAKIHALRRISS